MSRLATVENVLKGADDRARQEPGARPALQHTPSLRRVTRHRAGNRAFRIAEHSAAFLQPWSGSQLSGVARPRRAPPPGTGSPARPPAGAEFRQAKHLVRGAAGSPGRGGRGADAGIPGCRARPGRSVRTRDPATPRPLQKMSVRFHSAKAEGGAPVRCNCGRTATVLFRRAPRALRRGERDWRPTCISSP